MKHFLLALLIFSGQLIIAQDYFYLENIKLKQKADFTEHEATVIKAIDYLMSTPVDDSNHDRKACTRFIIRYAEKTPFITISLEAHVSKIYKDNNDILVFYMGLWLKSAINNKSGTTADHEKFIFTEIYKYAKAGNNINKNKVIKSLIKAGDENKIEEWIEEIRGKN